jgi:hypothetical protein
VLLVAYALAAAVMTIAGRASMWLLSGEILMGSPRYVGVGALFWTGAVVVGCLAIRESLRQGGWRVDLTAVWLWSLAALGLAAAYGSAYLEGLRWMREVSGRLATVALYLPQHRSMPAEILGWAYPPSPEEARSQAAVMDRLDLGLFSAPGRAHGSGERATRLEAEPTPGPPVALGPGRYALDVGTEWRVSVRRGSFTIRGETRRVIFAHPVAEISWPVRIPAGSEAVLETHLSMSPDMWGRPPLSDGVGFEIAVLADGATEVLASRHLDPTHREPDRAWLPLRLPLGRYAGRSVTIRLRTDPGPHGQYAHDWAGWGDPTLLVGEPRPAGR